MRLLVPLTAMLALAAHAAQPTRRPSDEERGTELYRRHCQACHGERNAGDGPANQALVRPTPALVGRITGDEEQIRVVLKGSGGMPGYEASFDRADAVRVLEVMGKLGPERAIGATPVKARPPAGQQPKPEPEGAEPDAEGPEPD